MDFVFLRGELHYSGEAKVMTLFHNVNAGCYTGTSRDANSTIKARRLSGENFFLHRDNAPAISLNKSENTFKERLSRKVIGARNTSNALTYVVV